MLALAGRKGAATTHKRRERCRNHQVGYKVGGGFRERTPIRWTLHQTNGEGYVDRNGRHMDIMLAASG